MLNAFRVLMAATLALLLVAACQPTPEPSPAPGIVHVAGQITIKWNIRGMFSQETYPAAPGGVQDRYLHNATTNPGPVASVAASQAGAGTLVCTIEYIDEQHKYHLVDHARTTYKYGSVKCSSDLPRLEDALKRPGLSPPKDQPKDCQCTPGTLILTVLWGSRSA